MTNLEEAEPDRAAPAEVVGVCSLFAAVGAGFTGTAPTGTGWWDVLLSAALAIAYVVAGVRASRTVLIGTAGLAAVFVGLTPWLLIAAAGFAAGLASEFRPKYRVEFQAMAAALTFLALLHLRVGDYFGLSAILAGLAVVAVFTSAYETISGTSRRRIRRALLALGVLGGALVLVGGIKALSVRSAANDGVAAARLGLSAARAGDTDELTQQLELAQTKLNDANDQMNSPLLKPLLLVPIAAQHVRSVSVSVEQGAIVADEALAATRDVDLDLLQLRQGTFDLDLLSEMAPRLTSTAERLEHAVREIEASRSPWLISPVDDQLQSLVAEVVEVLPEARTAAMAAEVMPGMLGGDGERRYLMLFGSPGESREFGGFVGGYAVIAMNNGALDLLGSGSINDLVPIAELGRLDDPSSYPVEYVEVEPALFPQNLTSTPNISLIARAVQDVFPELFGAPIDGVIYADPFALAAMTEFTGPVSVEGIDEPLDRDGLVDFIFKGQYEIFDGREQRFGTIGALAAATAASFESADLPGPEELGRVLGPLARSGRLQVITYDARENEFLTMVRLQRHFVAPPVDVDSFAVLHANATASKLDLYLHRSIRYDLTVGADGELSGIIEVELRSDIPADAPTLTYGETDGTNQVLMSLYSRHQLAEVTVDGEPHEFREHNEFGFFRYALFKVPVGPNQVSTVRFVVTGVAPAGDYQVGLWSQPLVNNDVVEVVYREPGETPIVATREMTETWFYRPSTSEPDQ